ncbi:unnamed protein product, partial [Amoebophrya sp. A120]|eukprot:GSA120T00026386001.1
MADLLERDKTALRNKLGSGPASLVENLQKWLQAFGAMHFEKDDSESLSAILKEHEEDIAALRERDDELMQSAIDITRTSIKQEHQKDNNCFNNDRLCSTSNSQQLVSTSSQQLVHPVVQRQPSVPTIPEEADDATTSPSVVVNRQTVCSVGRISVEMGGGRSSGSSGIDADLLHSTAISISNSQKVVQQQEHQQGLLQVSSASKDQVGGGTSSSTTTTST